LVSPEDTSRSRRSTIARKVGRAIVATHPANPVKLELWEEDDDGVTGGFNFQAAWTTGWLAGRAMAGGQETGDG